MTTSQGADRPSTPGFLLCLTCLIIFQCQGKPTDEPLAVRLAHAAVIVQVLLQVGEDTHFIVGVGHPLAVCILTGKQLGQVEVAAVHCRSQPLVRVVGFSVALADGTAVQGLTVVLLPLGIFLQEVFLFHADDPLQYDKIIL